ncbi:ABC-2 type transport system permease protein [Kibdelosporangium banguiense]|uniref:Transport permease protein n=1 Tax=Kibdelosporangium banguiense TaxID=1365924 RepID=A0ABS4TLC7_9PSEU|nr:ABC transporter permease [Kibdelosporangium banguiense]MBP2325191.1 ABC-2 type transport system permease protein [Kibdelosporangium banguiense]
MTNPGEMLGWVWPSVIPLVVLYTLRGTAVPGTNFSIGSQAIPGILGMNVVLIGMMGLAMALMMDQMDGTLLRSKAIPNGVTGYLTGRIVGQSAITAAVLVILLVPCAFLFGGLSLGSPQSWLMLIWVLFLGLIATLPIGAVIGSLLRSPQSLSFGTLLITLLVLVSGVFYPITALPEWLQWAGQLLPIYWLGLGMRAALLPDSLAVAEIGQSWRHLETVGVLGAWAAIGFVVAPIVLRRVIRR